MNFVGLMVAMIMMGFGSFAAYRFIEEPHIASNRVNAQALADASVERLQATVKQGAELTYVGGVLKLDGVVVPVPSSCSILTSYKGASGFFAKCWDKTIGNGDHSENNTARMGITRLTTSNPCGSELFPSTKWTNGVRAGVCVESENPPLGDLQSGHFDLDTYNGYNKKGLHVHEWNYVTANKSKLYIDLMDASNLGSPLKSIPDIVTNTSQKFGIIIVNPNLSPLFRVSVNTTDPSKFITSGNQSTILGTLNSLVPYTLGTGGNGVTKLTSLRLYITDSAILSKAGLIPTSTGFVNPPCPRQGKGGEYRNGALVVQIVKLNADGTVPTGTIQPPSQAVSTGCNYNSNGGIGLATSNVLYESSVFWHAPKAIYDSSSPYKAGDPSSVTSYLK